jgi:hypothetical protein
MEERKNILFGDIIVKSSKGKQTIKDAVFTEGDTEYKKMPIVEVLSFKIVGKTSLNKSYTEAKASDEKRNEITGAYE